MSKRPPPGKCVHCLEYFEDLTWDHILPISWYPKENKNQEKWVVPSCDQCNKKLGKIEEKLLLKLGLCLDPNDKNSFGIPDRVLRSLNPTIGKNIQDSRIRQAKRNRVINEIVYYKDSSEVNILPNFESNKKYYEEYYPSVMIEQEEVNLFSEKIVRGISFYADKTYIDKNFIIESFILEDNNAVELKSLLDKTGVIFDRRPGLLVKRSIVENEKIAGIYYIEVWGRLKIYVLITTNEIKSKYLKNVA